MFLLDFDKISMEILCNFFGVSMLFYGVSKGVSTVVLWDSYGVSKGCLWDFLWVPTGLCGISMIKGSLGGETSVLRTFRLSGKELVKERVSKERVRQSSSKKAFVRERVSQRKS